MELTLDLEFNLEKRTFSAFLAGDGDSGISVENETKDGLVNELMPYIKDYAIKSQRASYIFALERAVIDRGGKYDLTEREITLYDGDTETQNGENSKVLSLNTDGYLNLSIEVDYLNGSEMWGIEELTDYEVELIFNKIQD